MIIPKFDLPLIASVLKSGGLVVARTDTIYGILALASLEQATKRVYDVKSRDADKGCILLVNDTADIPISSDNQRAEYQVLSNERPTTIVVPVSESYLPHLIKPNSTLAFRAVTKQHIDLYRLLQSTSPLLAPSANPQGLSPAKNITEAVNYFGDKIDLYVDGGELTSTHASRIVALADGHLMTIRP